MATNGFYMAAYSGASSVSADQFMNPTFIDENTTEADQQTPTPANMTVGNAHVNVTANSRDAVVTGRIRIAGSNGNTAISITASTTGVFGDTSNTDVLTQADLITYMWDFAGGSGSLLVRGAGVERTA